MPLLKGRFVVSVKPLADVKPDETIYTIPHTNEQFRSLEEYERRVALYEANLWTCRCTGHINLTHREAEVSESEKYQQLELHFPEYYHRPVLMLVHHSTEVLESLVVEAWTRLHQRLVASEPVALKFKSQGSVIKGTVVKPFLDSASETPEPATNGCSPSSDKENKGKDAAAAGDHQADSPKKWTPLKLLPCKYNIRLEDGDKVISGVPSQDIVRLNRPPSKELIKLFIRAFAIRGGVQQNSPWSVRDDLITKYSIPSKFADFLVNTAKMMEYGRKAMEEACKKVKTKRKLSLHGRPLAKKRKTDTGLDKQKSSAKKQLILNAKCSKSSTKDAARKTGTPKKSISCDNDDSRSHSPVLAELRLKLHGSGSGDESSSEDGLSLATLKNTVTIDSSNSGSDDDVALADLKGGGGESGKKKKRVKSVSSDVNKHLKNGTGKDSGTKKKMKQMTLFDMKQKMSMTPKKKAPSTAASPMKSPTKSPYKHPPAVIRLLKAHKEDNKPVYYQMLSMCVKELSGLQRNRLPLSVKDDVMKRWKRKQERRKIATMTTVERQAYFKEKREEMRQMMKKKKAALNKHHEDTYLDLKPLPPLKLVQTPDSLPNELFGDIVMVTSFISSYRGLLMPEVDRPVYTDRLMKSLAEGGKGFMYMSQVLVVMLQTLLQDGVAEGFTELAMPLADLPANLYTVSELVRLCLSQSDDMDSEDGFDESKDYNVADDVIERLESCELYELEPREKLQVLVGLCHQLMTSYSVQDYMTSRQQTAMDLWRQKMASAKEHRKKEDGQKTKTGGKTNEDGKDDNTGLTMTHFFSKTESETTVVEEEPESLADVVKKRRLLSAKANEEKQKQQQEDMERRRKEAEITKRQKEENMFEKTVTEGIAEGKFVLRQCPMGMDRNHSRYWLFENSTPGLYVEKGWVNEHIRYRVRLEPKGDDDSGCSELDDLLESSSDEESNVEGRRKQRDLNVEKTFPPVGQNLWFTYDTVEEIDALIANLHPLGIRESSLLTQLKSCYPSIVKTLNAPRKASADETESTLDGSTAMVDGFRTEMYDLECRLRSSGLGGVPHYDDWLAKLNSVSSVKEFGECLTETQRNVASKFITGVLAKTVKKRQPAVTYEYEPEEDEKGKEGSVTNDGEKPDEDPEVPQDDLVHVGMQSWTEAIEGCLTLSRLHLLLCMFDTCIKWEKSAENAKCKICRKKHCEDKMLLCDTCNQAFHLYCLRPALTTIPTGDWHCPSCAPLPPRNHGRSRDYRQLAGEDSGDGGTTEVELQCMICGGENDVIVCATCPSGFHIDCHEPPLRHTPRSNWRCAQCVSGVRFRRKSRRALAQRKQTYTDEYEDSCSTEEDETAESSNETEDNDDQEEEVTVVKKPVGRPKRGRGRPPTRGRNTSSTQRTTRRKSPTPPPPESSDSDSSEEEEEPSVDSKILLIIIRKLERHKQAWPFMEKVDADEVPDYYEIVANPIDLETMREKVNGCQYSEYQEFIEDIDQLFTNARLYNKPDSIVGQCVGPIQKYSHDLLIRHLPQCVDQECVTKPVLNGDAC